MAPGKYGSARFEIHFEAVGKCQSELLNSEFCLAVGSVMRRSRISRAVGGGEDVVCALEGGQQRECLQGRERLVFAAMVRTQKTF